MYIYRNTYQHMYIISMLGLRGTFPSRTSMDHVTTLETTVLVNGCSYALHISSVGDV